MNKGVEVKHLKNLSMYSQLSMEGEPTANDCKPLGTHKTLEIISIIDELKSMEGYPQKEDN